MKILIVEPMKHPRVADIPHTLEAMQQTVGGYIQAVYPWPDQIALVCDDEGLLKQAEFNRLVAPEVAIFGTFFICGLDTDSFCDLPDDLVDKYSKLLYAPQVLIETEAGHLVLPLMDSDLEEGEDDHV